LVYLQVRRYKEQDWTKPSEDDYSDESEDDGFLEDDWDRAGKNKEIPKEDDSEEFHCIICGKHFRSAKQWKNHEQSKKHIGRVSALKDAFLEDDEQVEMLGRHLGVEVPAARQEREAMSEIDNRQTTIGADSEEEIYVDDISELDSDPSSNFQRDDTGQNGPEVVDLEQSRPQSDSVDEENDSNEDDEDSMLAAMLKSHLRQNTATSVSTERSESGTANGSIEIEEFTEHFSPPPSHNDTGHCPNEDGEKDENDDEHEDSILAAMLSSQKNKQKAVAADRVEIVSSVEDGDTHKDNETKNFEEAGVSVSQDEFTVKDSYPNKEVGESVGKGKARRRAKQEKKQAAVFDRHAATAAELASKERMQGEVLDNDSKVDRTDDLPPTEVSNAEQGWEESVRLKEIAQQNRSKLSQRGKKMKKGKVFA
jgi:DnaJ family protein A protein 5